MKLYSIETGNFKLDGGAMFGVVPKPLWEKTNPADSDNRIEMGARSLLIEEGDRLVLIDTGLGNKQSEKFFSVYSRWGELNTAASLAAHGFSKDDVTDVLFTHLHFDHCGGATKRDGEKIVPAFKNAKFWCQKDHWEWATISPNPRERVSFLKDNIDPIKASGQLTLFEGREAGFCKELGFELLLVDGHTEKMVLPKINYKGKTIVFAADLVPTVGHIPIPYLMGYDIRPLVTMKEKALLLNDAAKNDVLLFMQHDAHNEVVSLKNTENGVCLDQSMSLKNL